MGCAAKEDEPCLADEKPAHEVRISRGFWMGRTEVTVRAYKTYAAATNARMPANLRFGLDEQPMTEIDWNEAVGYCRWAGDLRLPTEAQWEYAASGVGHTGNQPPGASRLIAPSRMRKNSSPG
jgi:formylglycine-generating enzyme required for sulfatase activity